VSCYIVQEIDGVGRFTLEDGSGALLLELCPPPVPGGELPIGGYDRKRRRRLVGDSDDEWLAVILSEL
jgi:hypothetical protein